MKKKKNPLFVFTLSNQLGIALISGGIIFDSNNNLIEETKYYDLKKDCNGVRVTLSPIQKSKATATLKKR